MATQSPPSPSAPTDLTRLVETERALEARLARTREEAAGWVAQARAAVADAEQRVEQELDADARALAERLESEHRAAIAAIEADAHRAVAAYDGVADEVVTALVAVVIERLLAAVEAS